MPRLAQREAHEVLVTRKEVVAHSLQSNPRSTVSSSAKPRRSSLRTRHAQQPPHHSATRGLPRRRALRALGALALVLALATPAVLPSAAAHAAARAARPRAGPQSRPTAARRPPPPVGSVRARGGTRRLRQLRIPRRTSRDRARRRRVDPLPIASHTRLMTLRHGASVPAAIARLHPRATSRGPYPTTSPTSPRCRAPAAQQTSPPARRTSPTRPVAPARRPSPARPVAPPATVPQRPGHHDHPRRLAAAAVELRRAVRGARLRRPGATSSPTTPPAVAA